MTRVYYTYAEHAKYHASVDESCVAAFRLRRTARTDSITGATTHKCSSCYIVYRDGNCRACRHYCRRNRYVYCVGSNCYTAPAAAHRLTNRSVDLSV